MLGGISIGIAVTAVIIGLRAFLVWLHLSYRTESETVQSLPQMATRRLGLKKRKESSKLVVAVTGASGCIGEWIVDRLLEEGRCKEIRMVDIRVKDQVPDLRCVWHQVDIRDYASVLRATDGVDAVIHVASYIDLRSNEWNWARIYNINVVGTYNIISACVANGVDALIYTGSSAARFQGKQPRAEDAMYEDDEFGNNLIWSLPLPPTHYGKTKQMAEKAVLDANHDNLKTAVIIPHIVVGVNDRFQIMKIVDELKNKQKHVIFSPTSEWGESGFTYDVDIAQCHVDALNRLLDKDTVKQVEGQSFFCVAHNTHPDNFADLFYDTLEEIDQDGKLWHPKKDERNRIIPGPAFWLLKKVALWVDWFTYGTKWWEWLNVSDSIKEFTDGDHSYCGDKARRLLRWQPTEFTSMVKEICYELDARGRL